MGKTGNFPCGDSPGCGDMASMGGCGGLCGCAGGVDGTMGCQGPGGGLPPVGLQLFDQRILDAEIRSNAASSWESKGHCHVYPTRK